MANSMTRPYSTTPSFASPIQGMRSLHLSRTCESIGGPAGAVPMGAVEHLKTLCCLGLPAESAMIAVTPLLHEIIPHGATRMALLEPDATIGCGYNENPGASVLLPRAAGREGGRKAGS